MAQLRVQLPGNLPGEIVVSPRSLDTFDCRVCLAKHAGVISNLKLPARSGIQTYPVDASDNGQAAKGALFQFTAPFAFKLSDLAGMLLSFTVLQSDGTEITVVTKLPRSDDAKTPTDPEFTPLSAMIEDDDILLASFEHSAHSPSELQNSCNEVVERPPLHFIEVEDDDGFVLFADTRLTTT